MSREAAGRVAWTCPECRRTYRIPRSRPQPVRCSRCAEQRGDDDDEIEFAAVPSDTAKPATVCEVVVSRPAAATAPATEPGGTSAASGPTQEQLAEVLSHLESISRTMVMFRRFLWAIGVVALLNVLLVGASVLYGISMMGSLSELFSGSGSGPGGQQIDLQQLNAPNGGNALPEQMRRDLQAVEQYSDALNELLQEGR